MKSFLRSKSKYNLAILTVLILALFFRLYGLNWDQNQHLHPDERFLTMVTGAVEWPSSLANYLNPHISTLNPYSAGYDFFVYGTLPLKIVKFIASVIRFDSFDYNNITLVGRLVSALLDVATVFLVFKIGKKIFNKKVGMFSSFFYTISVLPIQLSHFYAVDTFANFFLVLAFYFLVLSFINPKRHVSGVLIGIAFGFALASKISSLFLLPTILVGFSLAYLKARKLKDFSLNLFAFLFFAYISFRLSDPRVFSSANFLNPILNPIFLNNLKQLQSFSDPETYFPPAIQWIKTTPVIFSLKNMMLWGLGIPLGILTLFGVGYSFWRSLQLIVSFAKKPLMFFRNITSNNFGHILLLLTTIPLFAYQSVQFVKTLRYFYPIYPFLSIISACFIFKVYQVLENKLNKKYLIGLLFTIIVVLFVWPISFISIYAHPHSRVSASEWIYNNIPVGSKISCEHWDDCLPLSLENRNVHTQNYEVITLELFNPDTADKWEKVNAQLKEVDYLILSSNRLWGTIPKVPEKYPITSIFYENLFSEKLQFAKVAEITSYPTIPLLNLQIPDDLADEQFTVFDHPKVMIFKKK